MLTVQGIGELTELLSLSYYILRQGSPYVAHHPCTSASTGAAPLDTSCTPFLSSTFLCGLILKTHSCGLLKCVALTLYFYVSTPEPVLFGDMSVYFPFSSRYPILKANFWASVIPLATGAFMMSRRESLCSVLPEPLPQPPWGREETDLPPSHVPLTESICFWEFEFLWILKFSCLYDFNP